MNLASLGFE